MSNLRELYQEVILDHNERPRNFGVLSEATNRAQGYNPLCGDRVSVALRLSGNTIDDIRFAGCGCAISQASASIMTVVVKGRTVDEAKRMFEDFHQMVSGEFETADGAEELHAFAGVKEYPIRVKCATLAWRTLLAALEADPSEVCSE